MNSFTVKINGTSEIDQALNIGESYSIYTTADCVAITKSDDQDGNFTFKHVLKPVLSEIRGKNGVVVQIKDTKKQSVKLRAHLIQIAMDTDRNPEEFYEQTLTKIRHFLPEILGFIERLEL
jgi:hypothetical protein